MASIKRKEHQESYFADMHSLLPVKKRKLKSNDFEQLQHSNLNHHTQTDCSSAQQIRCQAESQEFLHPKTENEKILMEAYQKLCKEKSELIKSLANKKERPLLNTSLEESSDDSMPASNSQTPKTYLDKNNKNCKKKRESTVFDLMWQQRYDELIAFWKKNGHCCVPQRYLPNQALGKWVHKQRQEFRKKRDGETSSLTPYRIEALHKIGFQVDTKNRAEALWQKRYKELVQFRKVHGHCNVPQKHAPNKALGKWVHRQRHEFKKMRHGEPSFLTKERIEALDTIGFQRAPGQQKRNNGPIQISSATELRKHLHRQELERNARIALIEQLEFRRQMLLQAAREKLVALNSSYISGSNVFRPILDTTYYNLSAKTA